MTLIQIIFFQTVCAKGSFSSAAEELFVSRSVVSRGIAKLEEEFNAEIFTRTKSGVTLTESGQILAQLFEEYMACYNTTKRRIRQVKENKSTCYLRLGVTPTNAYCLYLAYYDTFRKTHPDIHIRVEEHSSKEAIQLLMDGKIDAFFTPVKPPEDGGFGVLEINQNPLMLGVPENHPLAKKGTATITDILELPLGSLNGSMPIEHTLDACALALGKKQPEVVLRTSDQLLLKELTLRGIIYPILPLDTLALWEGIRAVSLDFCTPSINNLVWSRALAHESAMETFLDFMRKQI